MDELIRRAEQSNQLASDRVFTLATGCLALSITFRHDLVGDQPHDLWRLGTSWVCFTISIIFHVLGLALESQVFVGLYQQVRAAALLDPSGQAEIGTKHRLMIGIPIVVETSSFIAGIIFLAGFALANLH